MIYRKINIEMAATYFVSEETAKEFIDHRINKKAPLTQRAFERALKQAIKCQELGITADEAIEITIDSGWQGVKFDYIRNELMRRGHYETNQRTYQGHNYTTRSERADQQLADAINNGSGTSH